MGVRLWAAGIGLAVVFAVACVFLWRALARSRAEVGRLRQQLVRLERDRMGRPSLRASFEFNATTRDALLHVTNDGGDANVWAKLSVEGPLTQQGDSDLRAAWSNETASEVMLHHGETRTLQLAHLDLSVFPYAQWEIHAAGVDAALRAMHTSMIGGNPDTQAPTMFIQVVLASSPESAAPSPHSTIALQPFDAVRLRPV